MRIVLDTSVLVSGLRSRQGASFLVLRQVAARNVGLLLSTALFLEFEDVLKRPEQMQAHGFSEVMIDEVLAELAAISIPVEVHFRWRPQTPDPADEMVIETAVNGRADVIITHNVRDLDRAARRFGIAVFRPGEILTRMQP